MSDIPNDVLAKGCIAAVRGDGPTADGEAELDAHIAHMSKLNRAKLAMFDLLVSELEISQMTFDTLGAKKSVLKIEEILRPAHRLQRGELP